MAVIRGKVTDKNTGEPLYNVEMYLSSETGEIGNPPVGTVTDFDGNYAIQVNQFMRVYYLTAKHLGYKTLTKGFGLTEDWGQSIELDFRLQPTSYNLPEVEIIDKAIRIVKANPLISASIFAVAVVTSIFIIKNK